MKRALVVSNGIGAEAAFPNTKEVCPEHYGVTEYQW